MTEVLSQSYGRPGRPGNVEVAYLHGLRRGDKLTVKVTSLKNRYGTTPFMLQPEGSSKLGYQFW